MKSHKHGIGARMVPSVMNSMFISSVFGSFAIPVPPLVAIVESDCQSQSAWRFAGFESISPRDLSPPITFLNVFIDAALAASSRMLMAVKLRVIAQFGFSY